MRDPARASTTHGRQVAGIGERTGRPYLQSRTLRSCDRLWGVQPRARGRAPPSRRRATEPTAVAPAKGRQRSVARRNRLRLRDIGTYDASGQSFQHTAQGKPGARSQPDRTVPLRASTKEVDCRSIARWLSGAAEEEIARSRFKGRWHSDDGACRFDALDSSRQPGFGPCNQRSRVSPRLFLERTST